jgi:hypothetical protein
MLRRSSQSNAPRHRDGFGSAAHVRLYGNRYYNAAIVRLHDGKNPQDVQEALLEECRVHLQRVAHFRGGPPSRITDLTNAVEAAIGKALKEDKSAKKRFGATRLEQMRAALEDDGLLGLTWGVEENAVVERFVEAGAEVGVSELASTIIALGYLEDPRSYDAALAEGLSVAGYIQWENERREVEDRILQSGGHRHRSLMAEVERDWTTAPEPFEYFNLYRAVSFPTLPVKVTAQAITRFESASRWVWEEEKLSEKNQPATGELDEAREELEEATQDLCHVIRTQFEGREDNKAISYKDRTYVVDSMAPNQTSLEVLTLFQNNIPVSNVHWNKRPACSVPHPAPLSTNGKAKRARRSQVN